MAPTPPLPLCHCRVPHPTARPTTPPAACCLLPLSWAWSDACTMIRTAYQRAARPMDVELPVRKVLWWVTPLTIWTFTRRAACDPCNLVGRAVSHVKQHRPTLRHPVFPGDTPHDADASRYSLLRFAMHSSSWRSSWRSSLWRSSSWRSSRRSLSQSPCSAPPCGVPPG
jgi:hypothetical protein